MCPRLASNSQPSYLCLQCAGIIALATIRGSPAPF
jgi:hypothetical protein